MLIVDGTLVPTWDRSITAPSKHYRHSTDHQVAIDADTQLVAGARWRLTIATGYIATSVIIPHRRPGEDLVTWKEAHHASHRRVRARVEYACARRKAWKNLRDCRLRGDGLVTAALGVARLHNLAYDR